jgi:3-oxoacyl-[acyl-carrier-protein] synthase-3
MMRSMKETPPLLAGRAGTIRSLALGLPETIRTNDHWQAMNPKSAERGAETTLTRLWSRPNESEVGDTALFDREMEPYLADPFRGTIERRVLLPNETGVSLQARASRAALAAAALDVKDVDLVISCAFFPDHVDVGNAPYLVRELGVTCPAWNLESACSSSVVAYEMASSLVETGRYRNVLVAIVCTYSKVSDPADTLSCWLGDAGAAFVVSAGPPGVGYLAGMTRHTAETCGAFYQELVDGGEGPRLCMRSSKGAGAVLRETAGDYVRSCCEGAAARAGLGLDDIDFFVFNTPTAWYARFCANVLGIDPERTLSKYHLYGNVGPALMPVTLYHACAEGRIKEGDRVMLYSVGSSSTASANITRWGKASLG